MPPTSVGVASHVPCDILPDWSAFSYAVFSVIDQILNRSFQYRRIELTYQFPYRPSVTEKLERRRALDSVPSYSQWTCVNIHSGKNCRVFEFLCIAHKIRFHRLAIRAGRAVKHYNNRF